MNQRENKANALNTYPFPWREVMAFGFGVLNLPPASFWAMTPREIRAAFEGVHGRCDDTTISQDTLHSLMQEFPDEHVKALDDR